MKLPVFAAIPNYNMVESLAQLLPQLLEQDYTAIYVLDDASTDKSVAIAKSYGEQIQVIEDKNNIGAGGNRNRILAAHPEECIIHFLDADVQLESSDVPAFAQKLMADPKTAFVGGLIKENGKQMLWNYGPDSVALYTLLTASVQALFGSVQAPKPLWRNILRSLTRRARSEWPDPAVPPVRRAVYWPIEGNLLVRRSTLERLGGFDESVFEYDIIPPARVAYKLGLISYFDPTITVTHLKVNVRHYRRRLALYKELYRLIKRDRGWGGWILPEGHFKPRHNI